MAIPIPQPNIMQQETIDYCKWLIAHNHLSLARQGREWAVIVEDQCVHYNEFMEECGIYEDRFQVCREFNPSNCIGQNPRGKNNNWKIYETVEQFDKEVNPFYEREAK